MQEPCWGSDSGETRGASMKRISIFLAITFILTWAYEFGVVYPISSGALVGVPPVAAQFATGAAMFFPALGVLITRLVTREGFKNSLIKPRGFKKSLPWFVVAWFGPALLAAIGAAVGSDVPYCVLGGTALAEGRGEVLTPLPALPRCHAVLCKPAFSISTPELFARVDGVKLRHRPDTEGMVVALEGGDLGGAARRMYNIFEDVLPPRQAEEISGIKNVLVQHGALGANMSGTGPTVFGLFERAEDAAQAWEELRGTYRDTFLTETL